MKRSYRNGEGMGRARKRKGKRMGRDFIIGINGRDVKDLEGGVQKGCMEFRDRVKRS